jgi:hypothetical protein
MRPIVAALITIALLAGCSHKTTVTTSDGTTVTSSGDNQTVTVQGQEGTVVTGKGAVDLAKIGLPVYPGAVQTENTGYSSTNKEGSGAMALATTPDSFDKVYAWYQKQMPAGSEQVHMSTEAGSMAMFQTGKESDKTQKTVTITAGKDSTTIMLATGSKN